jgi:hypothetical protein
MIYAFKLMFTAILDYEQSGHEFVHRSSNQDRIGFSRRLQARRDIGRIAENIGLLAAALAHDHRACLDAYAN